MKNSLWVEKYRPSIIDDVILPKQLKDTFKSIIKSGDMPNMMFSGTAGVGKTTVAKILCYAADCDYLVINGSEDGNIDTLRTKIKQFASTVSLTDGAKKVVILDEADYLNPQSTQPALRGFIEEFSDNCRFILTCNFKNRIIAPLHSRCSVYDFTIPRDEKVAIAGDIFASVCKVLQAEEITFQPKVVAEVVNRYFPDFRRMLGELQRYSASGTIDSGILINLSDVNISNLVSYLKNKNFKDMRKWVADNMDVQPQVIFRALYDTMYESVQPQSIPQLVLILADYQYKTAFVADIELNVVACMVELMSDCEFK